jgi:PKD repeat protein
MRKIYLAVIMLVVASSLAGVANASTVSFSPSTVTLAPGSTTQVAVVLSDAPAGVAGYECVLNYPSSIVTITSTSFPSWANLNRGSAITGGYVISGVDLGKQVQSGTTDITLGTLTLTGVSAGTSSISLSSVTMNADDGTVLTPDSGILRVTVAADASATTTTSSIAATVTTTTTTSAVTTGTTTSATATAATVLPTATITGVTPTSKVTSSATAVPAATATIPPIVMVTPSIPGGPVCGFTSTEIAGGVPLKVSFQDRSTGSPTSWEWSFGDGGTSMTQNPSYVYLSPGTYTVSLTVTNDITRTTSTRTDYIRVLNPGETPAVVATAPAADRNEKAGTPDAATPTNTPIMRPSATPSKAATGILTIITAAGLGIAGYAIALRRTKSR